MGMELVPDENDVEELESLPWERLPKESVKQYQAFCIYRDMRPMRSLRGAYRQHRQNKGENGATTFSGQWSEMFQRFEWKTRAEAYDGYVEKQLRREKEEVYRQDLNSFRERQRTLSGASVQVATRMLLKASLRLDNMTDEQAATMDLRLLPTWVRAAAAIAAAATNAESEALAVSELLNLLDQQGIG